MITLEAVRNAVAAPDPYTRMDQLVRQEMASGRRVREIIEQFKPIVDDALDTPDLSEDGEEAILGTLDALMGNCRADQRYVDPPNTTLPTEDEIAKLPRWARVAFAARCARRVFPLYLAYWPEGRTHQELEARTLAECEESAREAKIRYSKRVAFGTVFQGMHPLSAVASTAVADAFGVLLASGGDPPDVVRTVKNVHSGLADAIDLTVFMRRDFDQLFQSSASSGWTDNSPVPPEVFGPFWQEGPPAGWPIDPDAPHHTDIAFDALCRDGLDEDVVKDEVVNLFNAMNRYHIARGGQPLSLEDFQPLISALVPAGV